MTATSIAAPTGALSAHVTDSGVAVITFDLPDEPVNKFTAAVKEEFNAALERQEQDRGVRAVVIISGKPDIFVAGADIEEFLAIDSAKDAETMSREGQILLDRIEAMETPASASAAASRRHSPRTTALAPITPRRCSRSPR